MAFYLFQLAYTPQAVRAMVAHPEDRRIAATKLIEALGGKLHHMFFSFGDYDVVCLIEGTDDKMMMAGSMAVAAGGAIAKAHSTKLIPTEDAMAAMAMAGKAMAAYRAPGN